MHEDSDLHKLQPAAQSKIHDSAGAFPTGTENASAGRRFSTRARPMKAPDTRPPARTKIAVHTSDDDQPSKRREDNRNERNIIKTPSPKLSKPSNTDIRKPTKIVYGPTTACGIRGCEFVPAGCYAVKRKPTPRRLANPRFGYLFQISWCLTDHCHPASTKDNSKRLLRQPVYVNNPRQNGEEVVCRLFMGVVTGLASSIRQVTSFLPSVRVARDDGHIGQRTCWFHPLSVQAGPPSPRIRTILGFETMEAISQRSRFGVERPPSGTAGDQEKHCSVPGSIGNASLVARHRGFDSLGLA
jgi:hypothetical protein